MAVMSDEALPRLIQPLLTLAMGPAQAHMMMLSLLSVSFILAGYMAARTEWLRGEVSRARQVTWIASSLSALSLPLESVSVLSAALSFSAGLAVALIIVGAASFAPRLSALRAR